MRTQKKSERIQKLVTLSEINLYRLDADMHLIDRYVLYPDEKMLNRAGEEEVFALLREEGLEKPIVWESANGDLIGVIREDDSFYLTSVQPQEKLVKLLAFLEQLDDVLFDRDTFQKDIMVRHNVNYNADSSRVEDIIETDRTHEVYHSFNDEMEFVQAIEQGNKEKVYEFLERGFIQTFRRTASDPLTHYKNICITAITLASRAAIRGGVPATMAYDFGNAMMKQVDRIPTVSQTYAFICSVFNKYTQMVVDAKKTDLSDNLIEQCRQYVITHYKEKITVGDIADYIGRSPNYLSAVFKEKTGKSLTTYINEEKISAAQNILRYSDLDVAAVANFLSYSSQAYFGKVFKDVTGMTPKKYKDAYRVKELSFETGLRRAK